MRPQRILSHLDQVVVPRLARGFARLRGSGRQGKILTAVGLAATAAVLVVAVLATHNPSPQKGAEAPDGTVHVGVAQGQSIPGYVNSSRQELQALVGKGNGTPVEVYALISLRAYLAPDRLTPVLGGVAVAEVYARVPLPQAQTQIVRIPAYKIPDDVVSGMRQVAARKEAEADEMRQLAAKLSEVNAAEDKLRSTYLDEATVALSEATAYRSACTCVYAAVVRATPAVLEQMAARPEVRAVDPAPEVLRLDQAVFLAPLPEQQDTVLPTPTAVPSPTATPLPTVTSPTPGPTADPPGGSPSAVPVPTPSPSATRSIEPLR